MKFPQLTINHSSVIGGPQLEMKGMRLVGINRFHSVTIRILQSPENLIVIHSCRGTDGKSPASTMDNDFHYVIRWVEKVLSKTRVTWANEEFRPQKLSTSSPNISSILIQLQPRYPCFWVAIFLVPTFLEFL